MDAGAGEVEERFNSLLHTAATRHKETSHAPVTKECITQKKSLCGITSRPKFGAFLPVHFAVLGRGTFSRAAFLVLTRCLSVMVG